LQRFVLSCYLLHKSENLLLFLFHGTEIRVAFSSSEGSGTEFRVVISSAERLGTEFRDFLFRGTPGIPSEITICSVYSVFRGIIFLSEIPNPNSGSDGMLASQAFKKEGGMGYTLHVYTAGGARDTH
jgi:hypothetical protein